MQKIGLACTKGGVGKTSIAINLAAGLAAKGKKCLIIDCDAQGNVQNCFNVSSEKTLADLLKPDGTCDIVSVRPGIDIINSGKKRLQRVEISISGERFREKLLSKRLQDVNSYDYVFCDLSPTITEINTMALYYVDKIIIPVSMSFYAVSGAVQILDEVEEIGSESPVELMGIVCNMFDQRTVMSKMIVDAVREQWKDKVFKTVIRKNVAIEESPSQHKTIFEHDPGSHGAEDFLNLTNEVLSYG